MVTSEQKKNFLEEYIGLQDLQNEQRNKLKVLLLEDTIDGKLYKYRTFDKDGYSLNNLRTQTVHCTSPDSFNDPFDCKVGIDLHSMIQDVFGDELKRVENMINSYVTNVLKEYQHSYSTEEQIRKSLLSNIDLIVELLKISFEKSPYKEVFSPAFELLPQYLENLAPKEQALFEDAEETFSEFLRNCGITDDLDELGMANQLSGNMGCCNNLEMEKGTKKITEIRETLNQKMQGLVNVGCLCTDYKNRLMWSHYADCHTGFCVEYDYGAVDFSKLSIYPLPVVYTDKCPKVPWRLFLNQNDTNMEQAVKEMTMVFLTKDIVWKYENEWRIIVPKQISEDICLAPISCVYLGTACSEENKIKIMEIARELKVPVKQMTIDRGEYQLHTKNINIS